MSIISLQDDQTDSSSCDSDRTDNCYTRHSAYHSIDKQVTDLHQILAQGDHHDSHHRHHQDDAGNVPVYWSASQLLSKLDQRKQGKQEDTNQYGFTDNRYIYSPILNSEPISYLVQ